MTELASEVLDSCPLCGASRQRSWRLVADRSRAEVGPALKYVSCKECGVNFLRHRLTEAGLGSLYPDDYEPYTTVPGSATTRTGLRGGLGKVLSALPNPAQRAADSLYEVPRGGGRLLDFGCGNANFLRRAQAQGWDPTGVDFPDSVVHAVRAAGIVAHTVDEAHSVLPPASFDVIRMNHVLEHLYDPRDVLSWMRRILSPGGVLHISVPNPVGVSSLLFRQHWQSLEPRHVILYPPTSLERLLAVTGFNRVSIVHETLSKDAVRSAGLMVAAHSDLTVEQAMRWSDNRVALALLRPAAWLAAVVHRSDRYHAFAGG